MAELADAADSKSVVRKDVGVRPSPGAPLKTFIQNDCPKHRTLYEAEKADPPLREDDPRKESMASKIRQQQTVILQSHQPVPSSSEPPTSKVVFTSLPSRHLQNFSFGDPPSTNIALLF